MKIALIITNPETETETFIKRHRDLITGDVVVYHGGYPSQFNSIEGRFSHRQPTYFIDRLLSILFKKINVKERALTRSLKKQEVNLCYAEFGPNGVGVMRSCKKLNIPLIVNFHGYDIYKKSIIEEYKESYLELFKNANKIIGVSREMCRRLEEFGCAKEKIAYLPCAPDDIFFSLSPKKNNKNIISTGRFIDKKAPYLTLIMFSKVLKHEPEAKLTMIGDGPLLTCCINLAKSLKINNVEFTGSLPHNKVITYYEDSSIFVQHSVTDKNGNKEGTPVSVMEASASSLPVVSTFHAGIPDVIEDKSTGFLVDEFDIDSMANKVVELLREHDKAIEFGNRGRDKIFKTLGPEKYKSKLNLIISESIIRR